MEHADLKERLQNHERAFEGMMSLIPADLYYGKDNSDQWQRKKQTKEEKRAARKAKLQPGADQSALEVHKAKEVKRKREDSDDAAEQPTEETRPTKPLKKQKIDQSPVGTNSVTENDSEAIRKAKADKRKAKREEKKAQRARRREKKEAKKARKTAGTVDESAPDADEEDEAEDQDDDDDDNENTADLVQLDISGLEDGPTQPDSSASITSDDHSTTFDEPADQSYASSSSSIIPPSGDVAVSTIPDASKPFSQPQDLPADSQNTKPSDTEPVTTPTAKPKALNLPQIDTSILQARLASKLASFRAARHADGPDGRPARSRAELIEARRRKTDARKQHKKELRAQARLEKDAEAEAARLRGGSGSPLWSPGNLPPTSSADEPNRFNFGRVVFSDNTTLDPSMDGTVKDPHTKKGPQDAKTALAAAERKRARLAALDPTTRADIEDKDAWLGAAKRIAGEKIRDDTTLLRRTVKRQGKLKARSEKAWTEREDGVRKGQEARQARREENLAKRRDEKKKGNGGSVRYGIKFGGGAGKKDSSSSSSKGPVRKRAGFEGTFKGSKGPRALK